MKLVKIKNPNSKEFEKAWKIYESSFPSDERRDLDGLSKNFKNRIYNFYSVYEKGLLIGILDGWVFDSFKFIEHLAIKQKLREKGLGTGLLKKIIKENKKLIIGEVEKPETEIAKRRIKFWEKAGFKLNKYDYIQPAYNKNKNPVPMFLLSYPRELSESEYIEIRREIHAKVYGCKKPLI